MASYFSCLIALILNVIDSGGLADQQVSAQLRRSEGGRRWAIVLSQSLQTPNHVCCRVISGSTILKFTYFHMLNGNGLLKYSDDINFPFIGRTNAHT